MRAARRRIRSALRRLTLTELTEPQAQLVRLLLREERRQRETTERRLAECRLQQRQALVRLAPDSATILELRVTERHMLEQKRGLSAGLEQRIARLLGPERAVELRTLAPVAHASARLTP